MTRLGAWGWVRKGAEEQRLGVDREQQGILELGFRGSRMSKNGLFWTYK